MLKLNSAVFTVLYGPCMSQKALKKKFRLCEINAMVWTCLWINVLSWLYTRMCFNQNSWYLARRKMQQSEHIWFHELIPLFVSIQTIDKEACMQLSNSLKMLNSNIALHHLLYWSWASELWRKHFLSEDNYFMSSYHTRIGNALLFCFSKTIQTVYSPIH